MAIDSVDVAKAAVRLAIASREEEKQLEEEFRAKGILTVAVDVGGNINNSIPKIIRGFSGSKRCGLIKEGHVYDGAVAGAARSHSSIGAKANGLNVGVK